MEKDENYENLHEKSRIFGQKPFHELEEKEVESYLSFLGFPNLPSQVLERTREGKNVLFLVVCKILRDYEDLTSKRKKEGRRLKPYHLKLLEYLFLNLRNRRRFSVYNGLFLKMIDLEKSEEEKDLEYQKVDIYAKHRMTLTLYFNSDHTTLRTDENRIFMSSNELNDIVRILQNYIKKFKNYYKIKKNGNKASLEDHELMNSLLVLTMKQILLLLKIMEFYKKSVGNEPLNELLKFIYYLYEYSKEMNSGVPVVDLNERDELKLVKEIWNKVSEVVKVPVKDNMLKLLKIKQDKKNKEEVLEDKLDEGPREEEGEEMYGVMLIMDKSMNLVYKNLNLVELVLNHLMSLITYTDEIIVNGKDGMVYVLSYYKVLVALKDSVLLKYNTNDKAMKIVETALSFVFEKMKEFYENYSKVRNKVGLEREKSLRKEVEVMWNVLVIMGNLNLEFIDQRAERVFEMMKRDYEAFSNQKLERNTELLLERIVNDDNISEVGKRKWVEREEELTREGTLPSGNFISELVKQYDKHKQLNEFFKYVQRYNKDLKDKDRFESNEGQEEQDQDTGNKRKKTKLMKKDELEGVTGDTNYLNNYFVIKSISELEESRPEVVKNLKVFEGFEGGMWNLVVAYLSKMEVEMRNKTKVSEQFISLCEKLKWKEEQEEEVNEQNNLMMMLQVVVTVRKLVGLYNPFWVTEVDKGNKEFDEKYKEERDLINKLMSIVVKIKEYLVKNINLILKGNRDIVLVNLIYHLVMINQDKLTNYEFKKEKKEKEKGKEKEVKAEHTNKREVDEMLEKVINKSKNEEVCKFMIKNMKVFEKNKKVEEYVNNHSRLHECMEENWESLKGNLGLKYFKRLVRDLVEMKDDGYKNGKILEKKQEDMYKRVEVVLENVIEADNEELVRCLLENIDKLQRELNVKGEKEKGGLESRVEAIRILMELLYQILNYEYEVGSERGFNMVITYQKLGESKSEEGKEKRVGGMNLFDVMLKLKRIINMNEYYENKEVEKKNNNKLFVKYHYIFTRYIWNHYEKHKVLEDKNKEAERLILSLMMNHIYPLEFGKVSREDGKRMDGEVYFLYKYGKMLKTNKNELIYREILGKNEIMYEVIRWYVYLKLSKRSREKWIKQELEEKGQRKERERRVQNVLEVLSGNDEVLENKYISKLVLSYLNLFGFTNQGGLGRLEEGSLGDRLYSVLLRVVGVLNEEDKCVGVLYKRNENELNLFFKNLKEFNYGTYKRFVEISILKIEQDENRGERLNHYVMLVLLVNNFNKEDKEKEGELYKKIRNFIRERQEYIGRVGPSVSEEESIKVKYSDEDEMMLKSLSEKKKERESEENRDRVLAIEIVLNYLMVVRFNNFDSSMRDEAVVLTRLILRVLKDNQSRLGSGNLDSVYPETYLERYFEMVLKLVGMLMNNINNICEIANFYSQFNQYFRKSREPMRYRELIKLSNLIINTNNYKYIRDYMPFILNIVIKTYYDIKHLHEDSENNEYEDKSEFDKMGKGESYEQTKEYKDKLKREVKEREMLKNTIVKYIHMCEEGIRSKTYQIIESDKIKKMFKEELNLPK